MKLVLAVFVVAFSSAAMACKVPCKKPNSVEALAAADLVFAGKILNVVPGGLRDEVTFAFTRQWKGEFTNRTTISVASDTCDAMGELAKPGDEWVIFAKKTKKGGWETGYCNGSVQPAADMIEELDKVQPRKGEGVTFGSTCAERAQVTQTALKAAATSCKSASDCVLVSYGCPFGCVSAVSKKADGDALLRLVADYEKNCTPCEYRCAQQPKAAKCKAGSCVTR